MVDFAKLVNLPKIKPEIQALIDRGKVTSEELRTLRANSREWEALTPALSIDALIERAEHAINNCPRASVPASTYTESVCNVFAPELIRRLALAKDLIKRLENEHAQVIAERDELNVKLRSVRKTHSVKTPVKCTCDCEVECGCT